VIWRNEAQVSNHLADILDKMVHEYFPQRYENAMEALDVLQEATVKVNPPKPRQTSTAKRTVNLNPSQPLPNQNIIQLGSLAGSGSVEGFLNQKRPKISIKTFSTVTVNRRGEIISRPQGQAEVTTENIGNGVSLEMVKIPGGRFLMGAPKTEAQRRSSEGPQHYVDVAEFFMGKYAVTQGQWEAVMGNNPFRIQSWFKRASRPVEGVSWYNATKFCQKLSQITGKKYSLPSESQWEYACRARTTTPFYFGETITSELVNYRGSSTYADAPKGEYRGKTTNVGIFPPNAFGLYDMHGNVWEWCADEWHDNYDGAPTDGSVWLDGYKDRAPLRGGSWDFFPNDCRSAFRNFYYRRDDPFSIIGFRVVCDGGRTL
jgi:formylglycine-generating enzyme required for sulfatase activity